MTLITDLTSRPTTDGTEEYVVNVGATDYKVTGAAIVAGVVTDLSSYITSNNIAVAALTADKLNLAGGTMTGDIVLAGAPTTGLHPTTKTYVDTALALKADATGAILDATATGVTASDTTESTALATTAYVGNKIEYDVLKKTVVNTATKVLVYADRGTINVTRTTTGTCTITLPDSTSLTSADRTEFYIVDAGNNAETYNIIINTAGADTLLGGSTTMSITSDGSSVLLYVSGTEWIIKDKVIEGTDTVAGSNRLATNAEALALSNTTAVITPILLGDVLDQEIYNASIISTASKVLAEADSKVWYVTRTSAGTCAITLPDASSLTTPARFTPEIWDVETAGTNAITITPAAGTIDGAASVTIDIDKAGLKVINDGTNYFTIANTQRASGSISGTSNKLAKFNSAGTGVEDSLILDDGDQLGFNSAVDFTSMAMMTNASFARTLKITQTGTTATQYAADFSVTGAGGSNIALGLSSSGATLVNTALSISESIAGAGYVGTNYNYTGAGGSVYTKGTVIASTCTTGAVTGHEVNLTGAATTNTGMSISATGAGTNTSLKITNGDIDVGTNAIDIILDTTTGTKIGTATSQKLAFYGATPIVQPLVGTDLGTILSDLGLRPAGGATLSNILVNGTLTIQDGLQASGYVLTSDATGITSWQENNSGFSHYLGEDFDGGIIYHLWKDSLGVEHGLIVSKTEQLTTTWQAVGTLVNADRSEDGAYNTALMTLSDAETYVTGLGAGWYLPSIDELNLLWDNRFNANKALRAGGDTLLSISANYWSSTEASTTNAYNFTFGNGNAGSNLKSNTYSVRAVRAF